MASVFIAGHHVLLPNVSFCGRPFAKLASVAVRRYCNRDGRSIHGVIVACFICTCKAIPLLGSIGWLGSITSTPNVPAATANDEARNRDAGHESPTNEVREYCENIQCRPTRFCRRAKRNNCNCNVVAVHRVQNRKWKPASGATCTELVREKHGEGRGNRGDRQGNSNNEHRDFHRTRILMTHRRLELNPQASAERVPWLNEYAVMGGSWICLARPAIQMPEPTAQSTSS